VSEKEQLYEKRVTRFYCVKTKDESRMYAYNADERQGTDLMYQLSKNPKFVKLELERPRYEVYEPEIEPRFKEKIIKVEDIEEIGVEYKQEYVEVKR